MHLFLPTIHRRGLSMRMLCISSKVLASSSLSRSMRGWWPAWLIEDRTKTLGCRCTSQMCPLAQCIRIARSNGPSSWIHWALRGRPSTSGSCIADMSYDCILLLSLLPLDNAGISQRRGSLTPTRRMPLLPRTSTSLCAIIPRIWNTWQCRIRRLLCLWRFPDFARTFRSRAWGTTWVCDFCRLSRLRGSWWICALRLCYRSVECAPAWTSLHTCVACRADASHFRH